MYRLKLLLIVVGCVVAFLGYEEMAVSQKASLPSAEVELGDIEKSSELSNNMLKIGKHWGIYPGAIYQYTTSNENEEPSEDTSVSFTYYPIISENHSYFSQIGALLQSFGAADAIPENLWPEIKQFSVLVKTKRFEQIKDIPMDWKEDASVEGLVINRIESLNSEETDLVLQSFPEIDIEKILILEEGRKPSSKAKSFGMMGGGGVLAVVGVLLLFARRK